MYLVISVFRGVFCVFVESLMSSQHYLYKDYKEPYFKASI